MNLDYLYKICQQNIIEQKLKNEEDQTDKKQEIIWKIIELWRSKTKSKMERAIQLYENNEDWIQSYIEFDFNKHLINDRLIIKQKIYREEIIDKQEPKWNNQTEFPDKNGLYLIGQVFMNPFTDEAHYYLKIGKASNLKARAKQYQTYTPSIWKIDFLPNAEEHEHLFQTLLKENFYGECTSNKTEWIEVSKTVYIQFCKKKFKAFELGSEFWD